MSVAGALHIEIRHDGRSVQSVSCSSQRPPASRLLQGKTAAQAAQLVPLLYGLCGDAQRAAASAAIAAAGEAPEARAELERAVVREALQEHLWRLLLDWPQQLGLPPLQAQFVRWHASLRSEPPPHLLRDIELDWLELPAEEWLQLQRWEAVSAWWQQSQSPAAQLLQALERAEHGMPPATTPLLPALRAEEACHSWHGAWDEALAARPELRGQPCETGALATFAAEGWLAELLRQRPARLLARTLCRLRELLELLLGISAPRVDAAADGEHAGLALVQTARGLLLHRVRLQQGRVEEYLIVAPTEWNFHPAGPLAAGLLGMEAPDRERLVHNARMLTLSLDPCLETQIEVCHA